MHFSKDWQSEAEAAVRLETGFCFLDRASSASPGGMTPLCLESKEAE